MKKVLFTALVCIFTLSISAASKGNDLPQGKPFQNLQNQINVINMTIAEQKIVYDAKFASLDAQIAELIAKDADLDAKNALQDEMIAALTVALNAVEARVSVNEDSIEALELADTLFAQLVDQLTTQLANLEASTDRNFATLYAQDRVLNQLIASAQNRILNLENRVRTLENNQNSIASQLNSLRNEVASYRTRLSALNNLLGSFCSSGQVVVGIRSTGQPFCSDINQLGFASTFSASLSKFNFCDSEIAGICVDRDYYESRTVFCPSGYSATGGGFSMNGFANIGGNDRSLVSRPSGNGWFVQTITHGNDNYNGAVYVRCLRNR